MPEEEAPYRSLFQRVFIDRDWMNRQEPGVATPPKVAPGPSVRLRVPSFGGTVSSAPSKLATPSIDRYLKLIQQAEAKHRIPPGLLKSMIQHESQFNPKAVSKAGAQGIAQLIPKYHPDVDPWNPDEAIPYAGRYLRQNYDRFGSWKHAVAAYNWGPTALSRHGLKKAPPETRNYLKKVFGK